MDLSTRQFGRVTVDEKNIITFPKGIPGFPDSKRFIILDHDDIKPFNSFQCIDDETLSFIIMDPFQFKPDYVVDIEAYLKEMNWIGDEMDHFSLYVIINATDPDPKKMTANLMGPLLINVKKNEGVQMVLENGKYSNKFPVFNQSANQGT